MNPTELVSEIQERARQSRATVTPYSFGELANMYLDEELVIDPDYQRLFRWSDEKQSQFLESLLLELPLPPLFLIQREDETYELADGLQRVSTYLRFTGIFATKPPADQELLDRVQRPLALTGCDLVSALNGFTFDTLPTALAIRLRRSRIDCSVTKLGSDPRLRYYIFKRLNTGGEKLSEQEARSSFTRMLNPQAVDFIRQLSQFGPFNRTIDSITEFQKERRFDEELVIRFFALLLVPDRFVHDVEPFLTEFLEDLAEGHSFNFQEMEELFKMTFDVLDNALGDDAFTLDNKNKFSVLHFEGIAVAAAELIREGLLDSDQLRERVLSLKRDEEFRKFAVGGGKNSNAQMRKRVEIARRYLRQ